MQVLSQLGDILGSPLGSFTYHVLLLLAVEAALGLAWADRQHTRREDAWRLPIAMLGLTVVRLPYVGAALVAWTGWITPETLLPPLERFADTASICLMGWAFAAPARRGRRNWDFVFGLNLVLSIGVCAALTLSWNRSLIDHAAVSYSTHWQSAVWTVWQLGLIPLASLAIVLQRREGWNVLLLAMFLMFLGRPLQIIFQDTVPNLPVWERLANLVAYPLIPVAVYQNIVASLRVRVRHMQDISQASIEQIKSLLVVIEVSQQMSVSLSLSTVLDRAARGVAHTLNADQCAIALPEDNDPGRMRLAAIYNLERHGRVEARSFPLQYQMTIQRAMRGRRHVIVEESDSTQLRVLFNLLGSSETGPLLVQPVLLDGEALGAIVVGNSRTRRPFTAHEAKLCHYLAGHLASAIQNARRYETAHARGEELRESLNGQNRSRTVDGGTSRESGRSEYAKQLHGSDELEPASESGAASDRNRGSAVAGGAPIAASDLTEVGVRAEVPMSTPEE